MSTTPPPPPPPPPSLPPPPPPGGLPAPPPGGAASGQPDVGGAISWAFAKFGQNAGVLIALAAVVFVVQLLGYFASNVADSATNSTSDCSGLTGQALSDCLVPNTGLFLGLGIVSLILTIVFWVLGLLATIGLIRAALKISKGEQPSFSDIWHPEYFWQYFLVALVVGICVGLGFILCILPGLFVIWVWQFAQYSALDHGPGVFASLGESYQMVMANKGPAAIALLVVFAANIVTILTCGIGALVVLPFMVLFMANMFRQLRHEPVAA